MIGGGGDFATNIFMTTELEERSLCINEPYDSYR